MTNFHDIAVPPLRISPWAALPLALSLAFAAQPGRAQEAPVAPPSSGKLPPVTVTAERRVENIKDVPSAVSQLRGEKLDVLSSGGDDVRLLSGRVPSLNVESSFGRAFPRFYIRGYGNVDFHLNASQPVSLIYDDVVQENPILKGFPMFDMEAVEVLAGPQGTLFGRNTPAGVVKFESVRPSQKREGYVNASIGRFNTINLDGAYTIPLTPEWSTRIALQSQHRGDWVTNTYPAAATRKLEGHDDNALRAQLLWQPRPEFSALFNVHGRDLKGTATLFRANIIKKGTNDPVDGFDPSKITIDGRNEQTLHTTGGSARLAWKLDGINLYAITGFESVRAYSRGDVDGGTPSGPGVVPFSVETADGLRNHRQITQELRAESTAAGPFKWQGGVYLFHESYDVDSYNFDSTAGGVQTGLIRSRQKNNAYALFGSINYDVTPVIKLRGGLRYTKDKKDFATQPDASLNTANGLAASTGSGKVSWDLSATYVVTPEVNLYGRVATGFRGASIQPAGAVPFGAPMSIAKPETIVSYELGAKADLLQRAARLSFDVFHYDVKDQQLSAVGGNANNTILINAKKAMGQGVEFTLDAYLTDNLLLTLGGSYNLTKLKDSSLAVFGCASCQMKDPANPSLPGTFFVNGNPLPQAPRYVANFTLRYGIPTANGGEYFVYTDWAYRSKINFTLYESTEYTGKAMLLGGLRAGYNWSGGKYEMAGFVRNLTDTRRLVGGIDFNNLTGFVNDPRTFGVQFKAAF